MVRTVIAEIERLNNALRLGFYNANVRVIEELEMILN
jgi:spore cortex formation protein SpoVR/YcgB (stage V sporulation)